MTKPDGRRFVDEHGISLMSSFHQFRASRVANGIGWFEGELPASFDENSLRQDNMIQVWRAPSGRALNLWRVYFLRKWTWALGESGESLIVEGPCINDLLRRRIVAAYSGSPQASKTDFADDMMKEVVTESIADGVAPVPTAGTRVWADLSIAPDTSSGPSISVSFAFDPLLTPSGSGALPAIAKAAREAGTEVFFGIYPDVVTSKTINFVFRTFIGQPGQDLTLRGVFFSPELGTIRSVSLEYDYSKEINYVYAGGQDIGASRDVQQVYDAARYLRSRWNRCEGFIDARSKIGNAVQEKGNEYLELGRPKVRFTCVPQDTPLVQFGVDWTHGDKVLAAYKRLQFGAVATDTTIEVKNTGEETVHSKLEYRS